LRLESGDVEKWAADPARLATVRAANVEGERYVSKRLPLPRPLPWGYHRLTLETHGRLFETMIISAPARAYASHDDSASKVWGVFLPLYALHSTRSWGGGDLADLDALVEWVAGLEGSVVATLPLLAAFLDEPCDPSPYAPASRLFWNEFYLDVRRIPELKDCPPAQAFMASGGVQREIEALRASPVVDYRRQMAVKRKVLEELARHFYLDASARSAAMQRFIAAHPQVEDYACFRATAERQRGPWPCWPRPLCDGVLRDGDYDETARRYHLYVQFVAHEQIEALSKKTTQVGVDLYLDLPLGVHAGSYDVWRERDTFALEVSGGAPPDTVFTKGQDWGFPPLHPEAIREQGYRYFIACLRHQLKRARLLRIDHVMALHRLFWIPRGLEAREGVYVRYPAEELYGILSLESHRHHASIVGENLGTVPAYVNSAMARHHLHRMYVAQYELAGSAHQALRAVPRHAVASLNTHDMPPFAGYWDGLDIEDRLRLGLLSPMAAEVERTSRQGLHHALENFLEREGWLTGGSQGLPALLKGCLSFLSASPAPVVLVNLEDLWLEREPQNVPGTRDERPNWQRKARYTSEAFQEMPAVLDPLRAINDLRRRGKGSRAASFERQRHAGRTKMASQDGGQKKVGSAGGARKPAQPKARPVSFQWTATEANAVSVVGDFNNWDPQAHPLRKGKDGLWKVTLRLKPGRYEYMFIVDGEWREDPRNPNRVPNPHGGFNSVCEVA
ncbi:MAG TPA: 4-alpha-glucanotransferase, partial [Candidatus Methylomirabilis sp.]|nr:4-alpha-glucanotransferase [Candidatus Methylomirabilis sp.]